MINFVYNNFFQASDPERDTLQYSMQDITNNNIVISDFVMNTSTYVFFVNHRSFNENQVLHHHANYFKVY